MKNSLYKVMVLLFLWGAFATASVQAQKAKVKSVEYKNYERPLPEEEEDEGGGLQFEGFGDEEEEMEEEMELEGEEAGPDTLALTRQQLKEYDEKGRLTKMELYLANPIGQLVKNTSTIKEWLDDVRTEAIAQYDEMGDPVLETKSYYSKEDQLKVKEEFVDHLKFPDQKFTRTFEYNDIGKPSKIVLTDTKGSKVGEEVYKYNQDDEEILYKKWETQPNGDKYSETKKTTYTDEGFLESSEKVIKDGKDTYKDVILFERNKIKEQVKYKNGEQVSAFGGQKAKFDPSKQRVMMDFGNGGDGDGFGGFGMLPEVEDEFDDEGRKIKTTETEGVEVVKLITYKYDKRSNLTETKEVTFSEGDETGSKMEQLVYDEENNLIRKAQYKDGDLYHNELFAYQYYGKAAAPKKPSTPAKETKEPAPKTEKSDKTTTPSTEKAKTTSSEKAKTPSSDKTTTPSSEKTKTTSQLKIEDNAPKPAKEVKKKDDK